MAHHGLLFHRSRCHRLAFLSFVFCWLTAASVETRGQANDAEAKPESSPIKTTWLIVRHAERDGEADALNEAGEKRAQLLAELGKAFNVTAIFSTDFQRTRATATPLAEMLNLPIQLYRQPGLEELGVGGHDFSSSQVILVVGHSNTVGQWVATLAGVEPFELDHDDYDGLFIVTVEGSRKSYVRLNFGSSEKSPTPLPPEKMGPQRIQRDREK